MLDQLKWAPWETAPKAWMIYEEKLPDGMWMTLFKRPDPLTVHYITSPEANNIYLSRERFDTLNQRRDKVWESKLWDPLMFMCLILKIRAEHGVVE